MVSLSKGALATIALLGMGLTAIPTAIAQAVDQDAVDDYRTDLERDITMGDMDDPGDPTQPVESMGNVRNTIVTFSSPAGRDNVQRHINQGKANGKKVKLASITNFKNPQRRGRSDPRGQARGNAKGNAKGKNKRELVAHDTTDVDIGFAIVETMDGETSSSEMVELSNLEGVSSVEYDIELTVAEVKSLRGANAANEHVREIIEAMAEEQINIETEFAPEHQDADAQRRNLAEETPYGINLVNVTHLWSIPPKQHVKICVVDTGYDLGHPDLPSVNVSGWDTNSASYGYWHTDGHSHGTHCAGTIGAIRNNDIGVEGVNPDPSKFSFHIGKGLSNSGSGSGSTVINAVNDCVAEGAKVISMSLGCANCYVSAYDQAYQDAYDQGVLIVAAAGNSGRDTAFYPSGYKTVMSVASVMESRKLSSFSTRNSQTEIAGPGHYVKSTVPRNKGSYNTFSGTSMACPHVAGVAALLMSHFPDCTNNQIRNAMIHSASEPPTDWRNTPGWDKYYGWGIVNAGNAYELLNTAGGCEAAGGAHNDTANTKLSDMALGGSAQKTKGCMNDAQCSDGNLCNGQMKCNLDIHECYTVPNSAPNCDDGVKCTIDTCDPTKEIVNGITDMCVHTPMTCEDGNKCNGIYFCQESDGTCQLSDPPVDCDDGNACTIDKCIPSTGLCDYTDKTCNDGNVCTENDRCDVNTGCVFEQPKPFCCGNAECESGETETSCPADCSDSITTSFDTSVARYRYLGSKFNIQAKSKNITIAGVGVHCILPEGKTGKVRVYTKGGDYYGGGSWYKKYIWQKVVETDMICAGAGKSTDVTFPSTVNVAKGQKQAFSIYVLTDDIMNDYPTTRHIYHSAGRHAVYKEDSYVQIQTGSGNFCASGWCAIITPMAYSGSFSYVVVDDSPTVSPTLSSMPSTPLPTSDPTKHPTEEPSGKPVTPNPTDSPTKMPTLSPTKSPSVSPTKSPSVSPTASPTVSIAPTEFVPEVVELNKYPSGWANILRAAYFTVTGGDTWARIVDLKVVTYRTTALKVYMKRGNPASFENVPCAWKLIAETQPGWYGSYWRKVYPPWKDGFDSVVIEPNEKVSFYVVNTGSSYGILGRRTVNRYNWYKGSWGSLGTSSPVGAMKMGDGRCGEKGKKFKPCGKYYSGYGMYGGLKIETMQPGSTQAPTIAPTEPFQPAGITSPVNSAGELRDFNGVQFDVDNDGDKDVIITSFHVHFEAPGGEKNIEVWYREGSHKGGSSFNCGSGEFKFNNWCKQWKKLVGKKVTSSGSGSFTATPKFAVTAKAGSSTAFAIVSPDGSLLTHSTTASAAAVTDGRLSINHATCIEDYYGSNVQTSHSIDPTPFTFEGTIDYDIANSACAIDSKAPWAKLATGATTVEEEEDADPELAEVVYEPEEEEGPIDGGPVDGGPVEGGDGGPEEDVLTE